MRHLWVVVALPLAGCAMVSLPSDVRIIPPGPGIPTEVAAYSGKWQGVWDEMLDHILVVEEINGKEATVVYAWGDSQAWRMSRGFNRVKGAFDGATLIVKTARPATVTYRMRPDGKLDAKYEWQGGVARAVMTKATESKENVAAKKGRNYEINGEDRFIACDWLVGRHLLRHGADGTAGSG